MYFLTLKKYRWITLLVASYFFYLNIKPVFALITLGITISTYLFSRLIEKNRDDSMKRFFMVINVVIIVLPLFFFKYFGNINATIYSLLDTIKIRWPLPEIKLLLPIGISFYTFMAIGYTVDVYNGEIQTEKNPGILALFISFFPLILSGPIERAKNLIPQFRNPRDLNLIMVVSGLKLMLWGYFMKLVVADRLAIYVDAIFNNISQHNGKSLLLASILYPFQIYADLGGYSLIAIGTASILGINVIQNFKRPFLATSMSEFWRRWHISLISWLTDYIYTPLTFFLRKYKIWGIIIALMITFFISGIWHGPKLTFIIWGILQGLLLSIEALTNRKKKEFENKHNLVTKKWYFILSICLTFILFSASQIFGRAPDLKNAFDVFFRIFQNKGPLFIGSPSTLIYGILGIFLILIKDFTDELTPSRFLLFENRSKFVRFLSYSSILILILLIGVFDGGQFIYFQF